MIFRSLLKKTNKKNPPTPVFVIGTGRSGTHWLGFSLEAHPDVFATIEKSDIFELVRQMASNPVEKDRLLPELLQKYRKILNSCRSLIYLDKSHPNIWNVDELKAEFPNALFLGIERNVYATVASMIKHPGVSAWHLTWRQYPIPNPFLGIDSEMADIYESLSMSARCALRWISHKNRMNYVKSKYSDCTFVIDYDVFALHPEKTMAELQEFLKLKKPIATPAVNVESLDKWKDSLTIEDIDIIDSIVKKHGILQ